MHQDSIFKKSYKVQDTLIEQSAVYCIARGPKPFLLHCLIHIREKVSWQWPTYHMYKMVLQCRQFAENNR